MNKAILMVHLFVAPAPYEGWGECPYDGTNLSQLLAAFIVIVSVSPLAVTLCLSLAIILAGGDNPYGTGTVFPLAPLALGSGHFTTTA